MIHIVTGEYAPIRGGVGDYTAQIAKKLAECGEEVNVWTTGNEESTPQDSPAIQRVAGNFGLRGLRRLNREFNATPPSRVIVQWTPHSFGFRSLNLLVALWLWKRARLDRDVVELMVHEPFVAFQKNKFRQNIAAVVHRCMMVALLHAANRVYVAIPAWESALRPWCLGRAMQFEWLPVPSNIETHVEPASVRHFRASIGPKNCSIVGHFGTYRRDTAQLLTPALKQILESSDAMVLLAGLGSAGFHTRFSAENPALKDRFIVTGELPSRPLATFLSVCDVLLQPYPDGISARRGSAMAAIALGLPIVTNAGHLSEDFWRASGAVELARSVEPKDHTNATLDLLSDPVRRTFLGDRAQRLYGARFDLMHTVNALRTPYTRELRVSRAAA